MEKKDDIKDEKNNRKSWYKSEPSKITTECEEIQKKYMECLINNKYDLPKCDHIIHLLTKSDTKG
jgi:hypothetical protein